MITSQTDVTVVGMCGITCSGKTSLTQLLIDYFKSGDYKESTKGEPDAQTGTTCVKANGLNRVKAESMLMDDYFLPVDDPRHIYVPEVKHFNWELMSSLDIDKMVSNVFSSIERLKSSGAEKALLVIDGFLVLNCDRLKSICDLKFFVDLTYDTCFSRRSQRAYDPPDVPGYFEKVVWPESQKNKAEIVSSIPDLLVLDGSLPLDSNFIIIKELILKHWSH